MAVSTHRKRMLPSIHQSRCGKHTETQRQANAKLPAPKLDPIKGSSCDDRPIFVHESQADAMNMAAGAKMSEAVDLAIRAHRTLLPSSTEAAAMIHFGDSASGSRQEQDGGVGDDK